MSKSIMIPLEDAKELSYGSSFDDYKVVSNEQIYCRRWVSEHELVIEVKSTGEFYMARYERGLTEMQDDDGFGYGVDPVPFWQVKPRIIETTTYEPI